MLKNKITREFIQYIVNKVNIIDIINMRFLLIKRGENYIACCPFHNEKTPSFTVSEVKQFYYCFGCGKHGNVIHFIMKYDHISFFEAVIQIANILHLKIPRNKKFYIQERLYQEKKNLFLYLERIRKLYHSNLENNYCSKKAQEYIKNKRGLKLETIKYFSIGYSIINDFSFIRKLSKIDVYFLIKAGILVKNKEKIYDIFQGRIIFPIRNIYGKTIGFGGRILNNIQKYPKYINSPETEIYQKKNSIYGVYEIPKKKNHHYLLVVEGYIDVITLFEFGIKSVVATLGTALTLQQLQKMYQLSKKIIFCFDGDESGRKAIWKILNIILPTMDGNYEILFLFFPKEYDPDSYLRKFGKKMFKILINNAIPLSNFLIKSFFSQNIYLSLDKKAKILNKIIPIIKLIPKGSFLIFILESLSTKITIHIDILYKIIYEDFSYFVNKKSIKINPIQRAIAYLIQNPKLGRYINIPKIEIQKKEKDLYLFQNLCSFLKKNIISNNEDFLSIFMKDKNEICIKKEEKDLFAQLSNVELPLKKLKDIKYEIENICTKFYTYSNKIKLEQLIIKSKSNKLSEIEKKQFFQIIKKKANRFEIKK